MKRWSRSRARCRRLRNAGGVISQIAAASSLGSSQHLAEHVCDPMLAVEAQQHALGAADHHLLGQELVVDAARVVRGVEIPGEVVAEVGEGERRVLGAAAPHRQQVVDGDPVHPRRHAGVATERAQPRGHLHEDLLRRVLGVLRMPQHPLSEAADVDGDRAQQLLERPLVAADGGGDHARRDLYSGHAVSR